ncbi:MAG: hypothetical protein ACRD51_03295, partial [Candidatus Acidiferrum sp.]
MGIGIGAGAGPVPGAPTVPSATVTFPNLPEGVTVWPSGPVTVTPLYFQGASFYIYATSAATPGPVTVTVLGTSGSDTHQYSFPLTVNPAAPFHLSISPPALSMTPGSPQSVQVTVVPNSGAPPAVSLSTSTLPARWDFANPVITGALPGPYTLTFDPTVASQSLSNFPLFVTAKNALTGDVSIAVLPVNLTVPFSPITAPTRSTVVRTEDTPAGAVYDAARKLVFTALPNINEIRVFSSVDAHLVATIPAFHPTSIDEAADGTEVFAGSLGQILTIDPDLFQVKEISQTALQPQL